MPAEKKSTPAKPAQAKSAAQAGPASASEPVDAATAEQTSDYTRRAGGYVLTDHGWVLEEVTDDGDVGPTGR